jgi:hypothetical protein
MILDAMTYSVMTIVVAMSFVVIVLAGVTQTEQENSSETL